MIVKKTKMNSKIPRSLWHNSATMQFGIVIKPKRRIGHLAFIGNHTKQKAPQHFFVVADLDACIVRHC